jgi:PHD/YefM family antitoxin component YafN of YafNO toxin-antitoxin module
MPSTRERVLALVKESPHLNQTEIAKQVGTTRQRVSQIIASEGLNVPRGRRGVTPRAKSEVAEHQAMHNSDAVPAYLAKAGGPVAVLLTAADLMSRGYTVYLPVVPAAAADLVAIDAQGKVKRVSVQRPTRTAGGKLEYQYPKPGSVETHALILTDEPVQYEPALRTRK